METSPIQTPPLPPALPQIAVLRLFTAVGAALFVSVSEPDDGRLFRDRCVAMRREYCTEFGGPNGGSGGRGGSVILRCDESLNTLAAVRHKVHHRAESGQNGMGKSRTGTSGSEVYIPVPVGTVVRDQDGTLCGELTKNGEELLVARGGRGGRGNEAFKTNRVKTPKFAEKGEPGSERWLSLELKLVADVGFVGVPNAGKSTLLAVCSSAKPKIADYPFTTVIPNLGVCDVLEDKDSLGKGLVLADIPGLLEGAHAGVGLGLAFLRHVQRCRVLVHVVSGDSPDPLGDYKAIQHELELFSPKLLEKPQVMLRGEAALTGFPHRKCGSTLREDAGGSLHLVTPKSSTRKSRVLRRTAGWLTFSVRATSLHRTRGYAAWQEATRRCPRPLVLKPVCCTVLAGVGAPLSRVAACPELLMRAASGSTIAWAGCP